MELGQQPATGDQVSCVVTAAADIQQQAAAVTTGRTSSCRGRHPLTRGASRLSLKQATSRLALGAIGCAVAWQRVPYKACGVGQGMAYKSVHACQQDSGASKLSLL